MKDLRPTIVAVLTLLSPAGHAQNFYTCDSPGKPTVIQQTPCLHGKETQIEGTVLTGTARILAIAGNMLDTDGDPVRAEAYAISHGVTEPEFEAFKNQHDQEQRALQAAAYQHQQESAAQSDARAAQIESDNEAQQALYAAATETRQRSTSEASAPAPPPSDIPSSDLFHGTTITPSQPWTPPPPAFVPALGKWCQYTSPSTVSCH